MSNALLSDTAHSAYSNNRAQTAYSSLSTQSARAAQDVMDKHHVLPSEEEVDSSAVLDWMRGSNVQVVVPMHEQRPVSRPMLQTLVVTCGMNPEDILMVNDRSHDEATLDARSFRVHCVSKGEVLACVNWNKLDRFLCRGDRYLRGKGMAVMAGYLFRFAQAQNSGKKPLWLAQHDAEIRSYRDYRGLQYLASGILADPTCGYVKMSKTGRGNERCMQVRSLYAPLATMPSLAESARKRAEDLFLPMLKHRWMLTGEFALLWELAMTRPFASHLLEETLITAWAEDMFSGPRQDLHTLQVANPYPRDDGRNPEHKEAKMQGQINRFLLTLLEFGPVHTWTLDDIARINEQFLSVPVKMGRILEAEEGENDAVRIEQFHDDRILPSVTTIVNEGMVNIDRLLELTH